MADNLRLLREGKVDLATTTSHCLTSGRAGPAPTRVTPRRSVPNPNPCNRRRIFGSSVSKPRAPGATRSARYRRRKSTAWLSGWPQPRHASCADTALPRRLGRLLAGADLVMGGHTHLPYTLALQALARPMWVDQVGTAVSSRTRPGAPNSVNLLRWGESTGCCHIEQWDFEPFDRIFVRKAVSVMQPYRSLSR